MRNTYRIEPYEKRNIVEKILDWISEGETINKKSHDELALIPSSTIYKFLRELEVAGFIEQV